MKGLGFSFVEVLSPCPTIWKMDPVEAQTLRARGDGQDLPRGELPRPHEGSARRVRRRPRRRALEDLPRILGLDSAGGARRPVRGRPPALDLRIKVAGFGGQGVLMLGEVLAEAGLESGYEVSWLPSYGPEMRSGTSNCHVRFRSRPIDSPLVSRPNVLLALNEPSLRKFLPAVEPGGIVLYNGRRFPEDCARAGRPRWSRCPSPQLADQLGTFQSGQHRHAGRAAGSHRPAGERAGRPARCAAW